MKNEPALKLAMSMHANPGVYALLIGSGVSKSAGIPTGWEIVLDLIRKVAYMEGEKPTSELETWYQQRFGEAPDYSKLLDRLTKTSAERMTLLRSYFEPTEEDREQGLKVPTSTHRAIATLAKHGYVRMILTTNFDRLIEMALEEAGIVPDVISSDDDLKGAMPYVHSRCVVVKLHGDYRDTRIKNTVEELANYSQELNEFLDRVFDEFGLLVCGWSGAWDTALRNAILRAPTRRFTTFWLAKGDPTDKAKRIIQQRRAEVIPTESADPFFIELQGKVESLQELDRFHPISTAVAVATVKRYLADSRHRIRLHDLVHEETERVYQELLSERFETDINDLTEEFYQQRMREYEALMGQLAAMLAALSYHDTGENSYLLTRCIERLTQVPRQVGDDALTKLQYYPALLLTYAAGISAIAAKHFHNLAAILKEPKYRESPHDEKKPAIKKLKVELVFNNKWVPHQNAERGYNSANNYLYDLLRPALQDYLPEDAGYEETFDTFEYLLALTYRDIVSDRFEPNVRFEWRYTGDNLDSYPLAEFVRKGLEQGSEWMLLKAGFFNGSIERFKKVVESPKKLLQSQAKRRI